uniref:Uncharacterized protein n=1 Tax=Anguilla anguilla TaxID=7936 RepID=A0A0E9Q5C2_ANGAN
MQQCNEHIKLICSDVMNCSVLA